MNYPFLFYLFPRDAYFLPSGPQLVDTLEALDQELALGLGSGTPFFGSLAERPEGEWDDRVCEAGDYGEFREEARGFSGEIREMRVQLPRPGRDPLAPLGLASEGLEVRGHRSLRFVSFPVVTEMRLVCPACGERQEVSFSGERPDPRFYCSACGGLTVLPDVSLELPLPGDPEPSFIPAPCYSFATIFGACAHPGAELPATPAVLRPTALAAALERPLGCGLRGLLVPGRAPW